MHYSTIFTEACQVISSYFENAITNIKTPKKPTLQQHLGCWSGGITLLALADEQRPLVVALLHLHLALKMLTASGWLHSSQRSSRKTCPKEYGKFSLHGYRRIFAKANSALQPHTQLLAGHLFMPLTYSVDFTVISTHAGRNPLRMAVLAEAILDHAQQ